MTLQGRGLHFGAAGSHGNIRIFSEAEWDAACAQARAWGMHYVHPKVGDWDQFWYGQAGLEMLKAVAEKHGLVCYPYFYVKGVIGGAEQTLLTQADLCAAAGNLFGGILLDIEVEWESNAHAAPAWSDAFGERLRAHFGGPAVVILYANPREHQGIPYVHLLRWASAYMPMVYFAEWTNASRERMTAREAAIWMADPHNGEWAWLAGQLQHNHVAVRPILPLIQVGNGLPAAEVTSWLEIMREYSYCGFWYDGTFPPYAEAVLKAPTPGASAPPPPPVPSKPPTPPVQQQKPPTVTAPVRPFLPHDKQLPPGIQHLADAPFLQPMSEEELVAIWKKNGNIPFDPAHALCWAWIYLVQLYPTLGLGAPRGDEAALSRDNEELAVLSLDSGHQLYYFRASGRIAVVGGGAYPPPLIQLTTGGAPATSASVAVAGEPPSAAAVVAEDTPTTQVEAVAAGASSHE